MPGKNKILFEKFEIIETLKKDEHAAVYLANHIFLGKKIILKSLNVSTVSDNQKIERFKREAKILAKLDHPNIIKVLDFGMHGDFFYISFEYFESKNLRQILQKESLNDEEKRNLVIQLFAGLEYAHNNGIIHRDLKPENILLGENHLLKISDFGLAQAESENFVTAQYSIVGTPSYMSPEQISGETITKKSDLFSAGIVVYEIYSKENPFLGADVNQSINKILNYNEASLSTTIDSFPEEISAVVKKLLKKNAAERFISAAEVLDDLGEKPEEKIEERKKRYPAFFLVILIPAVIIFLFLIFFSESESVKNERESLSQKALTQKNEQADSHENDNDRENTKVGDDVNLQNEKDLKITGNENISEIDENISGLDNEKKIETEEKAKFGYLKVNSFPWSEVFLDEERIDITPIEDELRVEAGVHNLTLRRPGYPDYSTEVFVDADKLKSISIKLDTLFGVLKVNAFPWAQVFINGKNVGETPAEIILAEGEYEAILKNPDYDEIIERVEIKKRDTLLMNFNFTK